MMAQRPARFSAIPSIPQQGLTDWQFTTLNAMKENIELLTGARSGAGASAAAITRAAVTVGLVPRQTMQRVTAQGVGFTISGVNVPSIDDYAKLISDVQQLANDVAVLRNTVNTLINQIKG
jgi:hypothetical protein